MKADVSRSLAVCAMDLRSWHSGSADDSWKTAHQRPTQELGSHFVGGLATASGSPAATREQDDSTVSLAVLCQMKA
jgi:hypothetical protein